MLQAKLDAVAKANNKYSNAMLSGTGGIANGAPLPNAASADGAGGSLLPAYQRLKSKIQTTNSNMKIFDSTPAAAGRGSIAQGGTAHAVPSAPSHFGSGERSPRTSSGKTDHSEPSGGNRMVGSRLTSNSGQSSPRLSARGLPTEPHLTISSAASQQPHPPFSENAFAGTSDINDSNRKSLRLTRNGSGTEAPASGGMLPIVPGVPLLGKQTRDSLKERLVI
jgi:hypothetical protein